MRYTRAGVIRFIMALARSRNGIGKQGQDFQEAEIKLVPEGVEGRAFYRSLADTVYQLVGGLRAGMFTRDPNPRGT